MSHPFKLLIIIMFFIATLSGCQKNTALPARDNVKKLSVVTTLFPLYDFARTICGDKATISLLLPPGVEAHSFEPKPTDLLAISKADIFIYTNPAMEPWANRMLKGVASPALTVVDASRGTRIRQGQAERDEHHHNIKDHARSGGDDPHIWLDLDNAQTIVATLTKTFSEKDPTNAAFYRKQGESYISRLKALDADFTTGLANCQTRTFLHGGHYAFGYLADRYGLTYHSAQSFNPDSEPNPASIAKLLNLVRKNSLNYVYAEELVSPRTAEMLAREANIKILMLHGAHNISKEELNTGATFIGIMQKNLNNLRQGLGCR